MTKVMIVATRAPQAAKPTAVPAMAPGVRDMVNCGGGEPATKRKRHENGSANKGNQRRAGEKARRWMVGGEGIGEPLPSRLSTPPRLHTQPPSITSRQWPVLVPRPFHPWPRQAANRNPWSHLDADAQLLLAVTRATFGWHLAAGMGAKAPHSFDGVPHSITLPPRPKASGDPSFWWAREKKSGTVRATDSHNPAGRSAGLGGLRHIQERVPGGSVKPPARFGA